MKKWLGWTVAAVLTVGAAALAWVFWFAGGSGEPSTELTTPELASTTTTGGIGSTEPTGTTQPAETGADSFIFEIDSTASVASFELGEILRGESNQVIGTTDQVAGQFQVDLNDLGNVEFSEVVINARTFVTDSSTRDRQIRGPIILDSASDEFEFITFSVTSVDGLAGSAAVGDTVDFTITGELTIKGSTNEVTFDVSVTLVDEATVEGTATTVVTRDQFGIGIPSVPSVADVTDEVTIGLDFVARAG